MLFLSSFFIPLIFILSLKFYRILRTSQSNNTPCAPLIYKVCINEASSSVYWLINVSLTFIILYNTVLDNERKSYMNAIIIYYSRSGNTEKIAKQLPSDLGVTCMVSLNCTFVFFYFLQSIMIFSHRSYPSSELFSDNV